MLNRFDLCDSKPILSHTISASVLRLIAEKGELYRLTIDPVDEKKGGVFEPGKVGVRAASSFNGFCEEHDRDLFASIDAKIFEMNPKNIRLLFFRAMAQEITKKASAKLMLDSFYWMDDSLRSTGEAEKSGIRVALGLRDNFHDFDQLRPDLSNPEDTVQFFCFDLECAPIFSSIGIINPESFPIYFSNADPYSGRIYRGVLFCVLPTAFGARVIFAWFKGSKLLVKPLLDRFVLAKTNLLEFSLQFSLEHCECTYFSPRAWSKLDAKDIRPIVELMSLNIDGAPYDIRQRPLLSSSLNLNYSFRRVFTNSSWAKMGYGRSKFR